MTTLHLNDNDPFIPIFHLWLYNLVQGSVPNDCYTSMIPAVMSDEILFRVVSAFYYTAVPEENPLVKSPIASVSV